MAITEPNIDAGFYLDEVEEVFVEDDMNAAPKHGTTVQAGWDAFDSSSKKKETGDYPVDFKFSGQAQLIRFLDDHPFAVYDQHWVDRTEGRRSFVCTGSDCPLCTIAGDRPRQKVAFNILALGDGVPTVQILTAPVTLARQLRTAHEDARRGPLSKHFWSIARIGTGRETQYTLERVRATEAAEEWDIDPNEVAMVAASATKHTAEAIYVSPHEEILKVARQLVS